MKRIVLSFWVFIFASLFLLSCGRDCPSAADKAQIIQAYLDSINSLVPEVKVNIYLRTDVIYDSDGFPVEMGKLVLVEDFQAKKSYQLTGYDYVEKIEIVGQTDDISLEFLNGKSNKVVHREKLISLKGTKTYTTSDPLGEKHKYYRDWLETRWEPLVIRVDYKDKNIFEGTINPANR